MNHKPGTKSFHRHSIEGLTCLLCSFRVCLTATSFNTLVRPRELNRRISGHLQRHPATWKHNKINCVNTWGNALRNRAFLGWKKCMVFRQRIYSYSSLICSSDTPAESNTTLPGTHFCFESFIGRIINSLCQSLLQKAFTRGSKQTKRCQLTRKRLR